MTLDPEWTPKSAGRSGSRWRTVRKQAFERDLAANAPCWICGKPIDYTAQSGPDSWQPDHVLTVHDFPQYALDVTNLKPSHARCNNQRGQADKAERKRSRELGEPSEDWGV